MSAILKFSLAHGGGKEIMCLGIAMQVVEIDGYNALCEAKGVRREVSLFALRDEPVAVGDYVMVHVGYAIQKMTEQEARSVWELLDEILAAEDQASMGPASA